LVNVKGFSWCKHEPKEIGISSLVQKNLCTYHNSLLSPCDAEAKKLLDYLKLIRNRELNILSGKKYLKNLIFHINGDLFERWLLKTGINLLAGTDLLIGSQSGVNAPSDTIVEICFGRRNWPTAAGAYFATFVGQNISLGENYDFTPIFSKENNVAIGWNISFSGFLFHLSIEDDFFTRQKKFWGFGSEIDLLNLHFHLPNMEFTIYQKPFATINIHW